MGAELHDEMRRERNAVGARQRRDIQEGRDPSDRTTSACTKVHRAAREVLVHCWIV